MRIETVAEYQTFLELEPVWNEVAATAGLDHPFLEHAWVRTWWECFGAGGTLQILVVKAGDRTVAIAPLIRTPIRMWGIKVRRLGFFYNAHVPRADFLIAQRPDDVYLAIWNHLSQTRDWDLIELCQLPPASSTLATMSALARQAQYPTVTWQSGASPYLPFSSTWAEYFNGMPGKHRVNLRSRLKRLSETGSVAVETISSGEKLPDALEEGVRLEAAAWKGKAGTAICSDSDVARFYSTLAPRAAERGWMQLHFLRVGPRRIAFDFSLAYKSRIHLLKIGYDPYYAHYSPSKLLLFMLLQNLFEQDDVREYDFLGQSDDWKLQWTKLARPNFWLFIFSNSFKGFVLYFIKSQLVPLLKRSSLRPLREFFLRVAAQARPEGT